MRFISVLLIVFCPLLGMADIQDRINDCEAKGGGKCVYSLLRELAKSNSAQPPENKCKCRAIERAFGDKCNLGEFRYEMTRDGRSLGDSACFAQEDVAYRECLRKSNLEAACR